MRPEELSDAIGLLEDAIIVEADRARGGCRRPVRRWAIWGAAACLCAAVVGIALLAPWRAAPQALPTLTISNILGEGGGGGGVIYDEFTRWYQPSPWREEMSLTSLPVFRNGAYQADGIPRGLGEEALLERLEYTAQALGTEIVSTEYGTSELVPGETTDITARCSSADIAWISADADGSIHIHFAGEGIPLTGEARFPRTAEDAVEGDALLADLTRQFSQLLPFSQPQITMEGSFHFDGAFSWHWYTVYDGGTDAVEALLNYSFRRVRFAASQADRVQVIHMDDGLSCAEELGEYPIITPQEARDLLLQGSYITAAQTAPAEEAIVQTELFYINLNTQEYLMPYYCFWVKSPPEEGVELPDGLSVYDPYYVPAVERQYLTGLPLYDGSVND